MNTLIETKKLYAPLALVKTFNHEKTNKIIGFIPCPCVIKNLNKDTQEFEAEYILDEIHDLDMPSNTSFNISLVLPIMSSDINFMNGICDALTDEVINTTQNREYFQAMMEVRPSIREYCANVSKKKVNTLKKSLL